MRGRLDAGTAAARRASLFIALLSVLVGALAPVASAGLREDVERIVRGADLGTGAKVGVSIVEAGSGTPLVAQRADELMTPASNQKLLTTGAALCTLGPDFRFRTKLILDRDRLVIVGDGDPAFGDPSLIALMKDANGNALDLEGFLDLWVRPVVDAGVKRLSEIVVDDRIFDREFVHPSWPVDQLNKRYCAQVSGINFHLNVLHFYPKPRPGQRPALGIVEPKADWLRIANQATSNIGAHDADTAWVARHPGANELTFYGNVKHSYTVPVAVTVHDMPTFLGRLLAARLESAGVTVAAVRLAGPHDPECEGEPIAPIVYTPIATVLERCNTDSQNLYAESLLKRMGRAMTGQAGSWTNGAAIVRNVAHDLLPTAGDAARMRVADGSGLSRDNQVAPATLAAWLNAIQRDERLGPAFVASLAVGGSSGTLSERFRSADLGGAVVDAKSGYINGVSCLSGYVTSPEGRRCCFSIMVNNLKAPLVHAKSMQERIVTAIAREMEAVAPLSLGQ